MKVGDLVQVNHYGVKHGPVGIIISRALSLPSEWWIVEWAGAAFPGEPTWAGTGKRETIRTNHLKLVY
jgi:hypothetical protein